MKIEHVAMYVKDLEGAKDFFIKFFGVKSNNLYHNTKTGFMSYFLTFDNGCRLEIMTKPDIDDTVLSFLRLGLIHLAFSVGSKEHVDKLTRELELAGYAIYSGPRTTGDGYYESCIIGPENNLIEITV